MLSDFQGFDLPMARDAGIHHLTPAVFGYPTKNAWRRFERGRTCPGSHRLTGQVPGSVAAILWAPATAVGADRAR